MSAKATRATELNRAISQLWQGAGIHSKDDFYEQVVPIYTALLNELKQHPPEEHAEQQLLKLLNDTTAACHRRWTKRLPLKRPGSDYRKYEIIYTEALITAMAVNCLKQHNDQAPEQLAAELLPRATLSKLQADPIVWEDWLGFFTEAEEGGLYAVSTGVFCQHPPPRSRATVQHAHTRKPPPSPGSGRAMLEALKTALNAGTLSYNQPGDFIHLDRAGRTFLEHPNVLKWCRDQLHIDEDLKTTKNKFSRLKTLKRSAKGNQLFYGKQHARDRRRIGYVLESPHILWSAEQVGQFEIEGLDLRP